MSQQDTPVNVPPMAVTLDWPAVELVLEGLAKLTIERAGHVHRALSEAGQRHLMAALEDAKKQAAIQPETTQQPAEGAD